MLAVGSPAYGKGCSGSVNSGGSAVQQYVESVPGSCGNTAAGSGVRHTKLPSKIAHELKTQGGTNATLLKQIATSEKYGAPQAPIRAKARKAKTAGQAKQAGGLGAITSDSTKASNPVAASFGAVSGGSDARVIALAVFMLAVALIVVGTALRRRRPTR